MAEFEPTNPRSSCLRTHCQTSGWSLAAQDVFNNITRTCVEAMAATQGGTQSLHTNALDEALALPTDFSAAIARQTQLFLQQQTDTCATVDPWGGSYFIEKLTDQLIQRARVHLAEIDELGGMAAAIDQGIPKMRIEEASAKTQARIDSGQRWSSASTAGRWATSRRSSAQGRQLGGARCAARAPRNAQGRPRWAAVAAVGADEAASSGGACWRWRLRPRRRATVGGFRN